MYDASYMDKAKANAKRTYKDHVASVIYNDDKFFVLDWMKANGSRDCFVRYTLDRTMGALYINGDLGSAVCNWYNAVTPDKLYGYLGSVDYFMEKLSAASDKYIVRPEFIHADLAVIRENYLGDEEHRNKEQMLEDFEEIESLYEQNLSCHNEIIFDSELVELLEKYDRDWYESYFADAGRRISPRVIMWAVGYRMAWEQLMKQ